MKGECLSSFAFLCKAVYGRTLPTHPPGHGSFAPRPWGFSGAPPPKLTLEWEGGQEDLTKQPHPHKVDIAPSVMSGY